MRQLFSRIINEQQNYGKNEKVKEMEIKLGNFPFDDRLINDGVPKMVVGPQEIENGAIYYGHSNNDKQERHGFGMQIWPDGSKYVGYWKNDKANGSGRLIHSDGDVYSGIFASILMLIGEWKDDMASGNGKYIDVTGMEYIGEWKNDKQNGTGIPLVVSIVGVEKWPDGAIYEGLYKDGKKNGRGKFAWGDDASYEGNLKDNKDKLNLFQINLLDNNKVIDIIEKYINKKTGLKAQHDFAYHGAGLGFSIYTTDVIKYMENLLR